MVAFVLRKGLLEVFQTFILTQDVFAKRFTLYAPFCRITDEESSNDRNLSNPFMLITTAGISGEGFNITRANYAIMVAPAFVRQVEEQAFYRIYCYG